MKRNSFLFILLIGIILGVILNALVFLLQNDPFSVFPHKELKLLYFILPCLLIGIFISLICYYLLRARCQSINVVSKWLSFLIVALLLLFLFWSMRCGLMFSDEGFFQLMAKYPQDVAQGTTQYYRFTHYLFVLSGGHLIWFRITAFLLNFASIMVFTFITQKILNEIFPSVKNNFINLFLPIFIASNFIFIHHSSPDYNLLSRIVVFAQILIMLLLILHIQLSKFAQYVLLVLIGVLTGLNLFIKFPEFIISVVLIMVLLRFVYGKYVNELILFIIGVLIAVFGYFLCVQSWHSYVKEITTSFHYGSLVGSHSIKELLLNNVKDFLFTFLILLVIAAFYYVLRRYLVRIYSFSQQVWFVLIILIILFSAFLPFNYLVNYMIYYGYFLLIVIMFFIYENIQSYSQLNSAQRLLFKKIFGVTGLLVVFLYVGEIGTDAKIFYQIPLHLAPLLILVLLLQLYLLGVLKGLTDIIPAVSRVISIFMGIILIYGICYDNYKFEGQTLFQQTKSYEIDKSTILIDKVSYDGLHDISSVLEKCGYHQGDYIAGYYIKTALVSALGGRSPVTPWYWNFLETIKNGNKFILEQMSQEVQRNLFIVLDDNQESDLLGFNLKRDFKFCGQAGFKEWRFNTDQIKIYRHIH